MRERISTALKQAMKDQEPLRVSTLRLICAALKERDLATRADDAPETDGDELIGVLSRMVKQREESIRVYREAGREDLAEREEAEIKIIREFLPRPLSHEEMRQAVDKAIRKTDARSLRDMGKVMGALKADYSGRMDFATAGRAVKAALA